MSNSAPPADIIRHGPYPELTWAAILVGYFLGAVIAVSIGYAALILGFSIEGSELAAILGFGILRGILRRNSIIENNITQTVASAVNGASSGMMFSVPAIFILGYGTDFNPVLLTFGAIAGAFLGIGFIIPLRKQMIDYERLDLSWRGRSRHYPQITRRRNPQGHVADRGSPAQWGPARCQPIQRRGQLGPGQPDRHAGLHERCLVPILADHRRWIYCRKGRRGFYHRGLCLLLDPGAHAVRSRNVSGRPGQWCSDQRTQRPAPFVVPPGWYRHAHRWRRSRCGDGFPDDRQRDTQHAKCG